MSKSQKYFKIGLPWNTVIFLAALTLPRVIGQDLQLTDNQPYINALLALAPSVIWVYYFIVKKVPKPFATMLAIGLAYGLMLAAVHQLAWNSYLGDDAPQALASIIPRISAIISSIATGLFTGAMLGAVTIFLKFLRGELTKR